MAAQQQRSLSSRLRHRVDLQSPPARPARNAATNETADDWLSVARCWAEVRTLNGRELLYAQQVQAEASAIVTIRWRPGVDRTMRVRFGSRLLYIDAAVDPDGLKVQLDLYCTEPKPPGQGG